MTEAEQEMKAMIDGLGINEPPATDVNVSMLSELELMKRWNKVTQALLEREETIEPKTDTGRDLHSERAAYLLEMKRRGLR